MPPDALSPSKPGSNQMQSSDKDLKSAITNVISPKFLILTQNALQNSKAKRKRVQAKTGVRNLSSTKMLLSS